MTSGARTMLICGAGPGTGRALALAATAQGMNVALVARSAETLDETAALVEAQGGTALCHAIDATDAAAMKRVVEQTVERFGRIDVLVHSLLPPHLFRRLLAMDATDLEGWRRSVEISTYGAVVSAWAVAPAMVAAGGGSMVFITATSALQGYPGVSAHAVGKAGIHALVQCLASELGDQGVRANAVAVGVITGATTKSRKPNPDPQVEADMKRARDASGGAMHRNITEREATDAVLFLAAEASSGITGQILVTDAGRFFH